MPPPARRSPPSIYLASSSCCCCCCVGRARCRRLGYGLDSTSEFSVLDVAGEMERARQRGPHSLDIVTPDNHTTASAAADFLPVRTTCLLLADTSSRRRRFQSMAGCVLSWGRSW